MQGRYYARSKSSLTAERVKNDPRFEPTMKQAGIMARASKLGAAAYKTMPAYCKEFLHYRMLTGKANLLLKEGLSEEEILERLIREHVNPIIDKAIKREVVKVKRKRVKRTQKPWYLRKYRRLRMVEWSIGNGKASVYPMEAIDEMVGTLLNDRTERDSVKVKLTNGFPV